MTQSRPLMLHCILSLSLVYNGCGNAEPSHEESTFSFPQSSVSTISGNYHALLIAVNYGSKDPVTIASQKDVKELSKILQRQYGFKTTLLTSVNETKRDEIITALQEQRRRIKSKDSFLLYYSGHGMLAKSGHSSGSTDYYKVILQPSDFDKTDIHRKGLSSTQLIDLVGLPAIAQHIFLIINSCFSGAFDENEPDKNQPEYAFVPMGQPVPMEEPISEAAWPVKDAVERYDALLAGLLLTSGGVEQVNGNGPKGHTVFGYYFVEALRKKSPRHLSGKYVADYTVKSLRKHPHNQKPLLGSLPIFPRDQYSDFIFVNALEPDEPKSVDSVSPDEPEPKPVDSKKPTLESEPLRLPRNILTPLIEVTMIDGSLDGEFELVDLNREKLAVGFSATITYSAVEDLQATFDRALKEEERRKTLDSIDSGAKLPYKLPVMKALKSTTYNESRTILEFNPGHVFAKPIKSATLKLSLLDLYGRPKVRVLGYAGEATKVILNKDSAAMAGNTLCGFTSDDKDTLTSMTSSIDVTSFVNDIIVRNPGKTAGFVLRAIDPDTEHNTSQGFNFAGTTPKGNGPLLIIDEG